MHKLICFTGGGTAGHVAPGCAIIEQLRGKYKYSYLWIGSRAENEKHILERFAVPYTTIPAGKFRRYLSLKNISDLFKIAFGFVKSFFILLRRKPVLVFSKGGYVSFPVLLAARLLRIPAVSHESDAIPGLATRLNAGLSDKVILGFGSAAEHFPLKLRNKLLVYGNPVRKEIFSGEKKKALERFLLSSKKPVLLTIGGSQGARQLNELIAANLDVLLKDFIVIHQCGKTYIPAVHHPDYICQPFFHSEYADVLAAADLVVTRGGASSLFEIAALKKPSIIIPLSKGASRGDQIRNARIFADHNAAIYLDNPDPDEFLSAIRKLQHDSTLCRQLSANLDFFEAGDAAVRIADLLAEIAGNMEQKPV